MGLDCYLRAKTTKREYKGATGACNGLFGIAPEDYGMVEIGYWRKPYDQYDLILHNTRTPENDEGHIRILPEEVDIILKKAKKILATHKFDNEDGNDISEDYCGTYTWLSKTKWKDTIKFFKEAKKILEEDREAEIYFFAWY